MSWGNEEKQPNEYTFRILTDDDEQIMVGELENLRLVWELSESIWTNKQKI